MTWIGIALLGLVLLTLLAGMWLGWRHRDQRTSATVAAPEPAPEPGSEPGALLGGPVEAIYVSTTVADEPLERVVAHGLGVRSAAVVQVHEGGVVIRRPGADDLYVPAGDLVGARTAAGMAGKVVGGDGLVVLRWRSPGSQVQLETGLRTRRRADREPLLEALRALAVPAPAPSADRATTPTTEETS